MGLKQQFQGEKAMTGSCQQSILDSNHIHNQNFFAIKKKEKENLIASKHTLSSSRLEKFMLQFWFEGGSIWILLTPDDIDIGINAALLFICHKPKKLKFN